MNCFSPKKYSARNLIAGIILFSTLLICIPASIAQPNAADGNYLYQNCTSDMEVNPEQNLYCIGFILGISGYEAVLRLSFPNRESVFCIPPNVINQQLMDVVIIGLSVVVK